MNCCNDLTAVKFLVNLTFFAPFLDKGTGLIHEYSRELPFLLKDQKLALMD